MVSRFHVNRMQLEKLSRANCDGRKKNLPQIRGVSNSYVLVNNRLETGSSSPKHTKQKVFEESGILFTHIQVCFDLLCYILSSLSLHVVPIFNKRGHFIVVQATLL